MQNAHSTSKTVLGILLTAIIGFSSLSEARKNNSNDGRFQGPGDVIDQLRDQYVGQNGQQSGQQKGDSLSDAIRGRRDVRYVEGKTLIVVKLLQDDNSGLRHQRWYVKTADGATVYAVYNMDFSERVPVEIGQSMNMGGEFKMTNQGPLLHWLHEDPKRKRPDGYVDLNGKRYGKEN